VTATAVADDQAALDRLFQALADPSRRRMVERLGRGPASVSELAKPFSMSLAAVVQHVQVLEAAGLIHSEKVGRVRTCRVDPSAMQPVERWVAERRTAWEQRFDRLGELLATEPDGAARPTEGNRPTERSTTRPPKNTTRPTEKGAQ
jgi:DNA-binding transcriptional ArsR family regulator